MKSSLTTIVVILLAVAVTACSSAPQVSSSEPRRVLGRDNDVRVDAQVYAETLGPGSVVHIAYEVQNFRKHPIAVSDLSGEASYDPQSRTITLNLGSELPYEDGVRKLTVVPSGEKKSFTTGARVNTYVPVAGPTAAVPKFVRVRVNYLGNVEPFEHEAAALPPPTQGKIRQVIDRLFPAWIEHNEAIFTNAIPIRWGGTDRLAGVDASRSRGRL
jgi:hypothetical protein